MGTPISDDHFKAKILCIIIEILTYISYVHNISQLLFLFIFLLI